MEDLVLLYNKKLVKEIKVLLAFKNESYIIYMNLNIYNIPSDVFWCIISLLFMYFN